MKDGGWQDQVGAIWGGFKITHGENKLPLEIRVKTIQLDEPFLELINQRLVLVYTGLTRLAKGQPQILRDTTKLFSISNSSSISRCTAERSEELVLDFDRDL